MAHETTKQMLRRCSDHRFTTRWLVGDGIDIGCGEDPLSKLSHFLPLMRSLRPWDLPDGDAMLMEGVADESFDFVHSSHCLEHLVDPVKALANWVRICRPGGHLVITVPDEDLYEQGLWPSAFNSDHKWTFTILKAASWSPRSISVLNLLATFEAQVEILKVERLDAGFDYRLPLQDQTRGGLAESAIEVVLRKKPRAVADGVDFQGVLQRAAQCLEQGRAAEARALLQQAHALAPSHLRTIDLLCAAHEALDELQPALELLDLHRARFERQDEVLMRLARLAEYLGRNDQALGYLEQAAALDPAPPLAAVYIGFQRWRRGEFRAGATGIAEIYRSRLPGSQIGLFADEQGQPVRQDGRTVVLSADAGLGDTLMFVRYAPLVRALGARVVVECQPELVRLLATMPDVAEARPVGTPLGGFDHRVPLHNLIGAFNTTLDTVPAAVCLQADPAAAAAFGARLRAFAGLKVGLVWAGNPKHPRNASRSVRTDVLAPLLATPGVQFVSLQKGGEPAPAGVLDWSAELHDMADTAALVQQLDLVISVDSAVVHLAGALGRPVWLLNRFDGCWRWMDERRDSPWYPELTLYRQPRPGAWVDVIATLCRDLAARAAAVAVPATPALA